MAKVSILEETFSIYEIRASFLQFPSYFLYFQSFILVWLYSNYQNYRT